MHVQGFVNSSHLYFTFSFAGVLKAIDGTHIEIDAPEEHQKDYLNRKLSHSVILQAVCNSRGLFTDCFAGIYNIYIYIYAAILTEPCRSSTVNFKSIVQ